MQETDSASSAITNAADGADDATTEAERVLITDRGDRYHRPRGPAKILGICGSVLPSGELVSVEEARAEGVTPCPRCDFAHSTQPAATDGGRDATDGRTVGKGDTGTEVETVSGGVGGDGSC